MPRLGFLFLEAEKLGSNWDDEKPIPAVANSVPNLVASDNSRVESTLTQGFEVGIKRPNVGMVEMLGHDSSLSWIAAIVHPCQNHANAGPEMQKAPTRRPP